MSDSGQILKRNLRRVSAGVALLIAFAVVGALVAYFRSPLWDEQALKQQEEARKHAAKAYQDYNSNAYARSRESNQGDRSADVEHQRTVQDSKVVVDSKAPPATDNVLRVLCRTGAGNPVPEISVACRIQGPIQKDPYSRYDTTLTRVTGHEGSFDITSKIENRVIFTIITKGWFAKSVEADFLRTGSITLLLAPAKDIRVRVLYSDLVPVTTSGYLRNTSRKCNWSFGLSSDGTVEIPCVAVDEPLSFLAIAGRRFGYSDYEVQFSPDELQSGRELQVIVPRDQDPKTGGIRVEFVNGKSAGDTIVLLEQQPAGEGGASTLSAGQDSWERVDLHPRPRYRVTVLGELSWRSEWLKVQAGEMTIVRASLAQGASVRTKFVDVRGQPIDGGVLRPSDGNYLSYATGRRPGSYLALGWMSGADGVVTLSGLPPGKMTLEAEAWGREPISKDVNLAEGSVNEIGDIVLEDATGEILVKLSGVKEGVSYAVFVAQPGTGSSFPFEAVSGAEHKLTGLPLRKYLVAVTFAKGGRVVVAEVELSKTQTTQTVELDASEVRQ